MYSDRSDSVDNQFRMCRDYVNVKYSGQVYDFRAYSDEDFTGANTNRPDLQRLLEDIRSGAADVLIVYQLDRLSRVSGLCQYLRHSGRTSSEICIHQGKH